MRHHWNSVSVPGVQRRGALGGTHTPLSLALTEKTETEHVDKRLLHVSQIFRDISASQNEKGIAAVVPENGARWKHMRTAHEHHLLVNCETILSQSGVMESDRYTLHLLTYAHRLLVNSGTKWNSRARGLKGCCFFGLPPPTQIMPVCLRSKHNQLLLLLLYDMDVSCHRPFLPGTSLEPAVIPTAQASSFTLQYFPYYV